MLSYGSPTYTFNYGTSSLRSSIAIGSRALASYTYTSDRNKYPQKLAYGNGDSVQYQYDDLGRVLKQTCENGHSITYDPLGNLTKYDNFGKFTWEHGREMAA